MRLRLGRPTVLSFDPNDDETDFIVTNVAVTIFTGRLASATDTVNQVITISATGTGPYTATWTPTALGQYTAYWTFDGGWRRLYFEVTEAPIVSVTDVRGFDPLLNATAFPTGLVTAARDSVEEEFENITGRSFVIRSRTVEFKTWDWEYSEVFPDTDIQRVTTFTVNGGDATSMIVDVGPEWIDVSLDAGVGWTDADLLTLGFPISAVNDCICTYEYGVYPPPGDVRRAALLRIRDVLLNVNSAIPDRATSFQVTEFGTYSLATAGRGGFDTGMPEVDAILGRHKASGRWAQ
ncbi:hypothetical protein [Streptacidiphilus albus]|uniref:hypothetical protein n=1 Tax=Streptacidiphilus albus TaxID=105425 RepID=UPI00054C7CD1|nr:hypothetical protein [Streptacidiphilus albus]